MLLGRQEGVEGPDDVRCYRLHPPGAVEHEVDVHGRAVSFDIRSYRLNLLYNFLAGRPFRWFLTGGLGREITGAGSLGSESHLGENVGAGLRWYLGKAFGLRLDARYVSIKYDDPVNRQLNAEVTGGVIVAPVQREAPSGAIQALVGDHPVPHRRPRRVRQSGPPQVPAARSPRSPVSRVSSLPSPAG